MWNSLIRSKQLGKYEKNQKMRQRKRLKADSMSLSDLVKLYTFLYPMDVKHIGLKSMISGLILRKYSRNQELKSVKNVKLIIPSKAVSVLKKKNSHNSLPETST